MCSYCDYYVDGRRLADVFQIGDFIPPFGWLAPNIELPFAEMLLRKRDSNFKPLRIPLFVCAECADYGCGVFTCNVTRVGDSIEWRNFAMEYDYHDELQQDDAERFTTFAFDATDYFHAFDRFMSVWAERQQTRPGLHARSRQTP